jgi:hypothetical protein
MSDSAGIVERLRKKAAEHNPIYNDGSIFGAAASHIEAQAVELGRVEAHRNDLADKITMQSVEIGALKARLEAADRAGYERAVRDSAGVAHVRDFECEANARRGGQSVAKYHNECRAMEARHIEAQILNLISGAKP